MKNKIILQNDFFFENIKYKIYTLWIKVKIWQTSDIIQKKGNSSRYFRETSYFDFFLGNLRYDRLNLGKLIASIHFIIS